MGKEKSKKLKQERGISFEEVYVLIQEDKILEIIDHPNKKQHANQKIILLVIDEYIYMVPFVEDEKLKLRFTKYPSCKLF